MKSKRLTLVDVLQQVSGEADLYRRLGEFICRYAELESACHAMFDSISGLSRPVARSIMGNARFSDLVSTLTKLVEVGQFSKSQKVDFLCCIDQLNALTQLRNKLVHRGATAKGEEITSTNLITAKSREAVEILRLHISDLENASSDLMRLHWRLLLVISPDILDKLDAPFLQRLSEPWDYRSVQPGRSNLTR